MRIDLPRATLKNALQTPASCDFRSRARRVLDSSRTAIHHSEENIMPYILGWLLGVPLIVLVILYLIFH
ncbi:hypothetical protein [Paraburkholderia sp.]|uniref:hypothetical protein n=1 Tax=Paraburkholderia sp. TaxID=1926495 RepID=UPI002F42C021